MTVLLIGGSPSAISRSGRLLQYTGSLLEQEGLEVETLQVRDLPPKALLHAEFNHPAIVAALQSVERADAIVFATPVYKAAYSGILKTFVDLLPQFGLKEKVVLPIASGGSPAHTLILDYALRPVLSSLYPRQILDSIYAVEQQIVWTEEHGLVVDSAIESRVRDGVKNLVAALSSQPASREALAA
jgi:FMN reductase